MRLDGKAAIVTGGGMGMGRAIVQRLASEGARVSVFDLNLPAAEETAALVREAGGEAAVFACDVSHADQVQAAIAGHLERFGALNVLVNNVGVMHAQDDMVAEITDAAWEFTLRVNLGGPFNGCKYALPHLIAAGGGSIVTTSSNAGVMGTGRPAYSASKAAVIAMMMAVARQHARDGVRANVVLPGAFNTPMLETVRQYPLTARHASYRPFGRIAEPHEIAGAVAFLASDQSAFITGSLFPVDGGSTAV